MPKLNLNSSSNSLNVHSRQASRESLNRDTEGHENENQHQH